MTNTDPMVEALVAKRDRNLSQIEALKQAAVDGDRDLSDNDIENITAYKRSINEIDKQLDAVGEDMRMADDARSRLALIAPSAKAPAKYRDHGTMIHDMLHAKSNPDAAARYGAALKRAADHMGTIAADTTPTAGDVAALYVDPIVGPVIRPDNAFMPLSNALGMRSMPSGSAFERPYISDAAFATGVAAQSAQKAELASEKFDAASDLIKRTTIGGYLNVSQQMLQWQPGAIGQVVDQMRARLSAAIEVFNVTEMATTTNLEVLADGADSAATIAAFYNASASVYSSTNQLATHAVMGPLGWARLGGLSDLGGRPIMPAMSPVNAAGSMSADTFAAVNGIAGLQIVVTPAIADDAYYVLNSACLELYGYYYPLFEATEPSLLGRQVAVAADVVAVTPTPYADSVVEISAA